VCIAIQQQTADLLQVQDAANAIPRATADSCWPHRTRHGKCHHYAGAVSLYGVSSADATGSADFPRAGDALSSWYADEWKGTWRDWD
jgi:hypothetical protein